MTKSNNNIVDKNESKKTKKRDNLNLENNQIKKFNKNEPIQKQKELSLSELNFNTGESFELLNNSVKYTYYTENNPFDVDINSLINTNDNKVDNNIHFIIDDYNKYCTSNKALVSMGINDKKRWLMKNMDLKI